MSTFLGMPAAPPRSPYGTGNLRGDRKFPAAAHDELGNDQLRRNLGRATRTIRAKRIDVTGELPDWEELRDAGSAIKTDTMNRLPELLEQLEARVTERGGTVHWARDGVEANEIVTRLVRETGSSDVIKVKSMATQEIGLNEHLEAEGITPYETDLAELIVQLAHDKPSHILVPAIHRNRDEIREIFLKEIPGVDPALDNVPAHLAAAARAYLREKFMTTKVAVSGANFGIAETGTLSVVESEGNGRMCLTLPDTLITVMGIEKVLPRYQDLEVFFQLLPRSSTGERMNPYTSLWTGVTPGDGPQDFHLVLLDNGRTAALADTVGREALNCIRCSACLNVCPVYERAAWARVRIDVPRPDRSGPHAAARRDARRQGRPQQLAPVRLQPLRCLLRRLPGQDRHPVAAGRTAPPEHRTVRYHGGEAGDEGGPCGVMKSPRMYTAAQKAASFSRSVGVGGRDRTISHLPAPFDGWSDSRDTAAPPKQSFRSWLASAEGAETMRAAAEEGAAHPAGSTAESAAPTTEGPDEGAGRTDESPEGDQ